MAALKRESLRLLAQDQFQVGDRAGLEAAFARALSSVTMVYQPIVSWSRRQIFAMEALLRSNESTLPTPGALLEAAERLSCLPLLGRRIRAHVAATACEHPDATFFVNVHPSDLLDDELHASRSPLSCVAGRVVLEITERDSLDKITDVRARIASLRSLGYRIAIDDLGAGYAGLSAFAQLEPDVVKVDMSLVRDIHQHPTKRKLVRSIVSICADLSLTLIVEGVEVAAERDALLDLGCDLLQGYLFARPAYPAPAVRW
ncbi:MAG TPA: EAL domain-containing protein [Gemmatimonadaceae bacterium]|nr:EAL domain-containing protein [Gemmatimonadaceae bacterium]